MPVEKNPGWGSLDYQLKLDGDWLIAAKTGHSVTRGENRIKIAGNRARTSSKSPARKTKAIEKNNHDPLT